MRARIITFIAGRLKFVKTPEALELEALEDAADRAAGRPVRRRSNATSATFDSAILTFSGNPYEPIFAYIDRNGLAIPKHQLRTFGYPAPRSSRTSVL